jgi:hypothetical protein
MTGGVSKVTAPGFFYHCYKLVEQEIGICRPTRSLRVKLCREEGQVLMFHSLVGIVVHIHEKRFPF